MSANESINDDHLPRNVPRPTVSVPEVCAKPAVPEVSLIFDGTTAVSTAFLSGTGTLCQSKLHPDAAPFTPQSQHQNQGQSLPFISYSSFRKNATAIKNCGSSSPQDSNRKQVRFDIATSTSTTVLPSSTPNYDDDVECKAQVVTSNGNSCVIRQLTAQQHRELCKLPKPVQMQPQPRAVVTCRRMCSCDNVNSTTTSQSPTTETNRIFELIQQQGDQIRELQYKIGQLQTEIVTLQTTQVRDLGEMLEAVRTTFHSSRQTDKSIQCCLDKNSARNSDWPRHVSVSSVGCQVNLSPDPVNYSPVGTAPLADHCNILYKEQPQRVDRCVVKNGDLDRTKCFEGEFSPLPPPTTDRSIAMYGLTLKYLPHDKLEQLILDKQAEKVERDIPAMFPNDMSVASMRYLEKYGLIDKGKEETDQAVANLWPKDAPHADNNKFLDVTAIRKQPKLL